jgi:hypothetical protein
MSEIKSAIKKTDALDSAKLVQSIKIGVLRGVFIPQKST